MATLDKSCTEFSFLLHMEREAGIALIKKYQGVNIPNKHLLNIINSIIGVHQHIKLTSRMGMRVDFFNESNKTLHALFKIYFKKSKEHDEAIVNYINFITRLSVVSKDILKNVQSALRKSEKIKHNWQLPETIPPVAIRIVRDKHATYIASMGEGILKLNVQRLMINMDIVIAHEYAHHLQETTKFRQVFEDAVGVHNGWYNLLQEEIRNSLHLADSIREANNLLRGMQLLINGIMDKLEETDKKNSGWYGTANILKLELPSAMAQLNILETVLRSAVDLFSNYIHSQKTAQNVNVTNTTKYWKQQMQDVEKKITHLLYMFRSTTIHGSHKDLIWYIREIEKYLVKTGYTGYMYAQNIIDNMVYMVSNIPVIPEKVIEEGFAEVFAYKYAQKYYDENIARAHLNKISYAGFARLIIYLDRKNPNIWKMFYAEKNINILKNRLKSIKKKVEQNGLAVEKMKIRVKKSQRYRVELWKNFNQTEKAGEAMRGVFGDRRYGWRPGEKLIKRRKETVIQMPKNN